MPDNNPSMPFAMGDNFPKDELKGELPLDMGEAGEGQWRGQKMVEQTSEGAVDGADEVTEATSENLDTDEAVEKTPEGVDRKAAEVYRQAEEFWEQHILDPNNREKSAEQEKFEFMGRTFQDRKNYVDRIDRAIARIEVDGLPAGLGEVELSDFMGDPSDQEAVIGWFKHQKTKLIMEQAAADVAMERKQLRKMQQKIESITEKTSKTEVLDDLKEMKKDAEKASEKEDKFDAYSKMALGLTKDFYAVYPEEARNYVMKLNNEIMEKAEVTGMLTRTEDENDQNLDIMEEIIRGVVEMNWRGIDKQLAGQIAEFTHQQELAAQSGGGETADAIDEQNQKVVKGWQAELQQTMKSDRKRLEQDDAGGSGSGAQVSQADNDDFLAAT